MSAYIPLKEKIKPYLETKFNDLPEPIKSYIKEVDHHELWDKITLRQRQKLVSQYDYEFDPSRENERIYFDSLTQQLLEIEDAIETWEASNCQNDPLRMKTKEDKLAELHAKHNEFESLLKQPYKDGDITSIEVVKRKSVYDQQKELICSLIKEKGNDPLRLPDYKPNNGRGGIKSKIRSNVPATHLIHSEKHFNKIWERMLRDGSLRYSSGT